MELFRDAWRCKPYAGRLLTAADDQEGAAPMVAVLNYATWQRDYASDGSVIGSTFLLNTHPVTIVGIAPKGFYGDRLSEISTDFFLPISAEPTLGYFTARNKPDLNWLWMIGRAKPGVDRGALQAKLSGLLRQSLGGECAAVPEAGEQTDPGEQSHIVLTDGAGGIAPDAAAGEVRAVHADGDRRAGAADCVCEYCQPGVGTRDGAASGDVPACGAGRRAVAAGATDDDREHRAGMHRRRSGTGCGLYRHELAAAAGVSRGIGDAGVCHSRFAVDSGAGICVWDFAADGAGVWSGAGVD